MKLSPTLLLVEDNADDEELTRLALEESRAAACRLTVVRDGAEALDYLFCEGAYAHRDPGDEPTLVLLDLNLPKVSGLEVLKRLRFDPRTRKMPVVVFTSSREDRDLVESYQLGANSYIQKPVNPAEFEQAVKDMGVYWLMLNAPPPPR